MSHLGGAAAHLPPRTGYDPAAGGTLPVSATAHWRRHPARPVLWTPGGGWLCGADLLEQTARAAGRLAAAGLRAGDRVLLSARSGADFAVALLGGLRLGLVVLPANTAYRAAEIAHLVRDARPRAALVDDPRRADWVREAGGALVLSPALPLTAAAPPPLDTAAPAAPALLCYTSGTTGRPKGAVISHGALLAGAEALRLAWRWTPADRLLLALPLFHFHGLCVGLLGTLHAGASLLLLPRFDPDGLLDASARQRATLLFGVPTMFARLAGHPRAAELRGLRLCVSGSAPLSAALHRRFAARTGQQLLERYGTTETGLLAAHPHDGPRRPGAVGLPLPGVELRLAPAAEAAESAESATTAARTESAGERPREIQARGPGLFDGYWEQPEASAAAFTRDGWFRTGDLGVLDSGGYLRIAGRAKELLISGGYNIYPREVEDALRAHPLVADIAVVGTPSAEWGEVVTAYLVARGAGPGGAPGVAELRRFAEGRLASYKHPRIVHAVAALPRNALGKVQKHRLQNGAVLPERPAQAAAQVTE